MNKKIYTCSQVYVAAFSISGYAWASWRYGYKPFNPVLGETYESQREDRGFHYISEQVTSREGYRHMLTKPQHLDLKQTVILYVCYMLCFQVSHHPPISACHAESENFTFWQGRSRVFRDPPVLGEWSQTLCAVCFCLSTLRSEMEEQVLGKVSGDHLFWTGQCCPAQVSHCFI